jgi:hypothetical protein
MSKNQAKKRAAEAFNANRAKREAEKPQVIITKMPDGQVAGPFFVGERVSGYVSVIFLATYGKDDWKGQEIMLPPGYDEHQSMLEAYEAFLVVLRRSMAGAPLRDMIVLRRKPDEEHHIQINWQPNPVN